LLIEPESPYGVPTAITESPTLKVEELMICKGVNSLLRASEESNAKSVLGFDPRIEAETLFREKYPHRAEMYR
jgi:hypothetical protein